ncbi:MAG: glycine zipper 2TM domain-containing protein [Xylophilus ampelinus]
MSMQTPDDPRSRPAVPDTAFAAEADANPYVRARHDHAAAQGRPSRALWVAVGGLSLAVAALGGTLLYQQGQRSAVAEAAAAAAAPGAVAGLAASAALIADADKAAAVARAPLDRDDPRAVPAASAAAAPARPATSRPVASTRTPDYGHSTAQAYPASAPGYRAAVCQSCGRIESVQPVVQRTETPNVAGVGIGTVAGGVLGGLLGNQVGKGNGRTVATVLGAVGGGFAGNKVEEHLRTTTTYQVRVRMDNGSVRSFHQAQPMAVGTPVRVEGNALYAAPAQRYGNDGGYAAPAQPGVVYTSG